MKYPIAAFSNVRCPDGRSCGPSGRLYARAMSFCEHTGQSIRHRRLHRISASPTASYSGIEHDVVLRQAQKGDYTTLEYAKCSYVLTSEALPTPPASTNLMSAPTAKPSKGVAKQKVKLHTRLRY